MQALNRSEACFFVTILLIFASGGPAGGQTFEKFDKQILSVISLGSPMLASYIGLGDNREVFAELFSKSDPPEAS